MWQDFLDASLRDNLTLIFSIVGSLSGLSFFLSLGWLRRARNSSQTILALEDENKQFRSDFAKAQVRLKEIDPDIIVMQLTGPSRLPDKSARAKRAGIYLNAIAPAVTHSAATIAQQAIFEFSENPDKSVKTALSQIALAEHFTSDDPELERLKSAGKRLETVLALPETVLTPEVFVLQDFEVQALANTAMEKGNLDEALFLSTLCAEKSEQRTGQMSSNHAAALTTLSQAQSRVGLHLEAMQTHDRCIEIYREILGSENPDFLFAEVDRATKLLRAGRAEDALDHLTKLEKKHHNGAWPRKRPRYGTLPVNSGICSG
ncbi:tetratricopeptide repeat protein [Shimia abyssi]|uniref:Tetratricopeptide repeat protein n=1 Tax=Shimia abyssi TaxID=1662395 RepID=A0A2P8FE58_9RHOB|nr:tetratricopeptide repeat protein [Shimia abyssi]PSL20001.1 hypothetical protein CLV88_10460 [Shimia abyssi]